MFTTEYAVVLALASTAATATYAAVGQDVTLVFQGISDALATVNAKLNVATSQIR